MLSTGVDFFVLLFVLLVSAMFKYLFGASSPCCWGVVSAYRMSVRYASVSLVESSYLTRRLHVASIYWRRIAPWEACLIMLVVRYAPCSKANMGTNVAKKMRILLFVC